MNAPTQEAIARAIDPDSWRLRDSVQYAHLPDAARDAVVRRSMEQAGRVGALLFAERDALRSGIEALADEWEAEATCRPTPDQDCVGCNVRRAHAAALRALLSGGA